MAHLYRSNSLINHNTSPRTPHKRFSVCNTAGPTVCSSPGCGPDVLLENSYSSFDAGRSPGGLHSPLQGRSTRELEEQLSSLRKDNFNLKLRIYFMEENQKHTRGKFSNDSVAKQLLDCKIEIEVLRKQLDEKTELLKDAARAITEHEEMQKKSDLDNEAMIEKMQQYINQLEANALQNSPKTYTETVNQLNPEAEEKLELTVLKAEVANEELQRQVKQLEADLSDRQELLDSCEAKIKELVTNNAKLLSQVNKHASAETVPNALAELRTELANKSCELQDAEEKLAERERVHEQACRSIQKLMQKVNSQEKELKRLKQEQQQSEPKAATSKRLSLSDTEIGDDELSHSLKQRYEQQLGEQNELIKQLQSEVKKKTANLQNLVNKELWEKNREVERLTKLVSNQNSIEQSGDDSAPGAELHHSFTEAEYTRAVKRNKLLQKKVDVLIQRLNELQHEGDMVSKLRMDLHAMQCDVESANKWRLECADVCGVLTNRLEELAGFLNSLLKHKDVLGVLAADRRHAMRRAIDRSLDLSKSLNMTLSITGVSLADQSLAQISKLSEILFTEAEGDECNRTYNSHEEIHTAANAVAKAEAKAPKSDGQGRKERRSLPLPQQQHDNHSESEAWSEPDRKVSLARIGLEDTSNSLVCGEKRHSESDSEGHAANSAKQDRSRTSDRLSQMQTLLAQKDERLLQAQCQLVDVDNRLKQEQLRVIEITQQMEELRQQNNALLADLQAIGNQDDKESLELQRRLEEKTQQLDELQMAYNSLMADAQITDMELQETQHKIEEMEAEYSANLNEAHAELEQFKLQASAQLEEQARLHQEALARDWVAMSKHSELKTQLIEMQENERELKHTLVENELAARSLKKELDESTLQASKAVMERTKAYNDKLQVEKRFEELKSQMSQLQEELRQQQERQNSRTNGSDVSQSGYTSEEVPVNRANAVIGRISNPSPDLGIESDVGPGRVVSVELSSAQRSQLKTVELSAQTSDHCLDQAGSNDNTPEEGDAAVGEVVVHDCAKVEQEMAELRRKLIRTKRAFEDTYEKLRVVNKTKAQVEKDIKNQILKTHNVLRNVRSNMENVL